MSLALAVLVLFLTRLSAQYIFGRPSYILADDTTLELTSSIQPIAHNAHILQLTSQGLQGEIRLYGADLFAPTANAGKMTSFYLSATGNVQRLTTTPVTATHDMQLFLVSSPHPLCHELFEATVEASGQKKDDLLRFWKMASQGTVTGSLEIANQCRGLSVVMVPVEGASLTWCSKVNESPAQQLKRAAEFACFIANTRAEIAGLGGTASPASLPESTLHARLERPSSIESSVQDPPVQSSNMEDNALDSVSEDFQDATMELEYSNTPLSNTSHYIATTIPLTSGQEAYQDTNSMIFTEEDRSDKVPPVASAIPPGSRPQAIALPLYHESELQERSGSPETSPNEQSMAPGLSTEAFELEKGAIYGFSPAQFHNQNARNVHNILMESWMNAKGTITSCISSYDGSEQLMSQLEWTIDPVKNSGRAMWNPTKELAKLTVVTKDGLWFFTDYKQATFELSAGSILIISNNRDASIKCIDALVAIVRLAEMSLTRTWQLANKPPLSCNRQNYVFVETLASRQSDYQPSTEFSPKELKKAKGLINSVANDIEKERHLWPERTNPCRRRTNP